MDDYSCGLEFDPGKEGEIRHHSYGEHDKLGGIAGFGREML